MMKMLGDDHIKLEVNEYCIMDTIGYGSFARVFLASEKGDPTKLVAIKSLRKSLIVKERKVKYVAVEKEILKLVSENDYFVRLCKTFQDDKCLYFVLNYAANGELLYYIRKYGCFSSMVTQFYSAELLSAIYFLNINKIIHRDIKPENILLDDKMHLLLTDFGSAVILREFSAAPMSTTGRTESSDRKLDGESAAELSRSRSFVGTAEYLPPELLSEEDKYSCLESDIWAFGCIVYQMITGRFCFSGANNYQTFLRIRQVNYTIPDPVSDDIKDLLAKIFVAIPSDRLGATRAGGIPAIMSHPFYASIDFVRLRETDAPEIAPFLPRRTLSSEDIVSTLNTGGAGVLAHNYLSNEDCSPINPTPTITPSEASTTTNDLKIPSLEAHNADTDEGIGADRSATVYLSMIDRRVILFSMTVLQRSSFFSRKCVLAVLARQNEPLSRSADDAATKMSFKTSDSNQDSAGVYILSARLSKIKKFVGPLAELHFERGKKRVFFIHTLAKTYYFALINDADASLLHTLINLDNELSTATISAG